mmetsp:Transcript_39851/g.125196  ORF Transcript_39851/g.125196 Transcript_39851/m.125196 type:complete len:269 (-) Transcript_39851:243-1049(-)
MKSVSRISCKKMMVSFTDCSRFVSIHVCRLFIKLSLASLGYPPRTPTVRVGYRALLSPPAPSHTIAPSSLIANFCVSGSTGLSKPASSREGRRATREQEETGRCERLLPSTTEVRTEETLLCCSPLLSPSPRAPARCHRTPILCSPGSTFRTMMVYQALQQRSSVFGSTCKQPHRTSRIQILVSPSPPPSAPAAVLPPCSIAKMPSARPVQDSNKRFPSSESKGTLLPASSVLSFSLIRASSSSLPPSSPPTHTCPTSASSAKTYKCP